jgi:hypothetical protein
MVGDENNEADSITNPATISNYLTEEDHTAMEGINVLRQSESFGCDIFAEALRLTAQ